MYGEFNLYRDDGKICMEREVYYCTKIFSKKKRDFFLTYLAYVIYGFSHQAEGEDIIWVRNNLAQK
jgi:hypothetical protein